MGELENQEALRVAVHADLQKVLDTYHLTPEELITILQDLPQTEIGQMAQPVLSNPEPVNQGRVEAILPIEQTPIPESDRAALRQAITEVAQGISEGTTITALDKLNEILGRFGLTEAGQNLKDWCSWLVAKPAELQTLATDQIIDKLKMWHRALDYYLAADPATEFAGQLPDNLKSDFRPIIAAFIERQRLNMALLQGHGIERITATPGSRRVAGLVEASELGLEPTSDPDLDGLVASVLPGEGGFRTNQKVIIAAAARLYKYSG